MNSPQPFSENNLRHILAEAGDEFVLLETSRITRDNHHSYLFSKADDRLRHYSHDDPIHFLQQCENYTRQGYYLAGWFSYEFGYDLEASLEKFSTKQPARLLADLGVYPSCRIFDHTTDLQIPKSNTTTPATCNITDISLSQTQEQYIKHIHKIKEYILAGDTYQVNYTLKLLFKLMGSEQDLYLKLRRNQQVSYSAYIKQKDTTIMSFSPELFFKKQGNKITVRPMKGTIGRGCTRAEDKANGIFLQTDLKNLAENVMIVDLLRNDLGRIARKGMVSPTSLFDIETYNSLLQMTSTIQAEVSDDLRLPQLFTALFPCGSVTGAPKIHTMEIIKSLETEDRGVYTGAIGFLGPHGNATFNVPIRTIVLRGSEAQMGIGSGIVADSDPEQEWQECLLKGQFLTDSPAPFEIIETLLWQPQNGYQFSHEHEERLKESAHYFNFPLQNGAFTTILGQVAVDLSQTSRVRITLNHEGVLTSQTSPCAPPASFTPAIPLGTTEQRVCLASQSTKSNNPFLYHKTTNRDLYNQTFNTATQKGFTDALFTNERDEVSEGCISNIFLYKNDILLTPPVKTGLLPGIFRQILLEQFPKQVKEEVLYLDDLLDDKTTVCIGNSVRGLIPVKISVDE